LNNLKSLVHDFEEVRLFYDDTPEEVRGTIIEHFDYPQDDKEEDMPKLFISYIMSSIKRILNDPEEMKKPIIYLTFDEFRLLYDGGKLASVY